MSKTSPTQRSLVMLRRQGYVVAITERWNPHANVRQDLFGFIDLVALSGTSILAIQTTSGPNLAARRDKILSTPAAEAWLESGGRIVIHGWRKITRGVPRPTWDCREEEVTLADFESGVVDGSPT